MKTIPIILVAPGSTHSPQNRRIERALRCMAFCLALLLFTAYGRGISAQEQGDASSPPQTASDTAPQSEKPDEGPINLDLLLFDPVTEQPDLVFVAERKHWLAGRSGNLAEFAQVAQELAARGALASAIEVLWFAEKMSAGQPAAAEYRDQMAQWSQAAKAAEPAIEEAAQFFVAGREKEAIDAYLTTVEKYPLNERAHFYLADAWRRIYDKQYGKGADIPSLEVRVRVFRNVYQHYKAALAIDPLYYDAYYGLSEIRGMFPDNQMFLMRTQDATQRALDFRGEVLPVLGELEKGEDGPEVFARLGAAFAKIQAWEYAIYAYQVSVALGGEGSGIIQDLQRTHLN